MGKLPIAHMARLVIGMKKCDENILMTILEERIIFYQ